MFIPNTTAKMCFKSHGGQKPGYAITIWFRDVRTRISRPGKGWWINAFGNDLLNWMKPASS